MADQIFICLKLIYLKKSCFSPPEWCQSWIFPEVLKGSIFSVELVECPLRAFQCNETKLEVCSKIYGNNLYNLYMLVNPSVFFKIYVYLLFFEKLIFLFNSRSYGRMHFISIFIKFYIGTMTSYRNFTRDIFS